MPFPETIEESIKGKFDKFWLQFVEEVVFWKLHLRKNRNWTEWPENDLGRYKGKGTPYMLNYYNRVPNFTAFREL